MKTEAGLGIAGDGVQRFQMGSRAIGASREDRSECRRCQQRRRMRQNRHGRNARSVRRLRRPGCLCLVVREVRRGSATNDAVWHAERGSTGGVDGGARTGASMWRRRRRRECSARNVRRQRCRSPRRAGDRGWRQPRFREGHERRGWASSAPRMLLTPAPRVASIWRGPGCHEKVVAVN